MMQSLSFSNLPLLKVIAVRSLACTAGLGLILAVHGCNGPETISQEPGTSDVTVEAPDQEPTEDIEVAPETPPVAAVPSEEAPDAPENQGLSNTQVSELGLGIATLGMTLGELKQALPDLEFSPQSPFIVDFDAIAVRQEEETLFYILHLAGSPLQDDEAIQGVLTDNPIFKTAEGVGVGTPLQTAEVAYGPALLSYNTGNESREYVRFENHPATNISFGTQKSAVQDDTGLALAGVYEDPPGQYNETSVYQTDAAIEAILVVCLSATCSQ